MLLEVDSEAMFNPGFNYQHRETIFPLLEMYFHLLTDCSNLFINKPNADGKFYVSPTVVTESKETIIQHLLLGYVDGRLIVDESYRQELEAVAQHLLNSVPLGRLIATPFHGNVDCCRYFLYTSLDCGPIWITTNELDLLLEN